MPTCCCTWSMQRSTRDERIDQVREVLRGIGAGDIRELFVFNKID